MPFDGFSSERIASVPSSSESRLVEAQSRVNQAQAQLNEAQQALDHFFTAAEANALFDENQKHVLHLLRGDENMSKVYYKNEQGETVSAHPSEYFQNDQEVLVSLQTLTRNRQRASDAHVAAIRALEALRHPAAESVSVMPKLEPINVEQKIQAEWAELNRGVQEHLLRLQEMYKAPIVMPFQEGRVARTQEVQAEPAYETPGDPFADQQQETPAAPRIEALPDPVADLSMTTKKRGVFSSLFS